MRDTFNKILQIAVNAPSGDNSQPWRFTLTDEAICVFNVPGADQTLYNFRERGSYLAHGALVENIAIAAAAEGLEAHIEPFPGELGTARLTFRQTHARRDTLYDAIPRRATNRKPYALRPLEPAHKEALREAAAGGSAALSLIEERNEIISTAEAISVNERLVMENRSLHDFLFGMIRWNAEEERAKPGLNIDTMEFPAPQRFALRFLKHWSVVQALNCIGFSRVAPKGSAALFASSGALGALTVKNDSDSDFFEAGRVLQRIWLTATQHGVSIQPLAALPYLAQRVAAKDTADLSPEHIALIRGAYGKISRVFGAVPGDTMAMLFRIGYGPAPTARSLKLPPRID